MSATFILSLGCFIGLVIFLIRRKPITRRARDKSPRIVRGTVASERLLSGSAEFAALTAARTIVSARSRGFRTSKCRPSTPSRTFSAIPPMPAQMTGLPLTKASWITIGEFSHQIEGTTTQSTSAHALRQLALFIGSHPPQCPFDDQVAFSACRSAPGRIVPATRDWRR